MKNFKITSLFITLLLIFPVPSFADVAVGDMIITLGENLTEEQKNMLLSEMNAPEDAQIITVSNAEEHQYLGNYVAKSVHWYKSDLIFCHYNCRKKLRFVEVETNNINWVTDEMYINALITAGVKDAKIYITAPMAVSGTGALTGIIKGIRSVN